MSSARVVMAGMAALAIGLSGVPASTADEDPLAAACADAPQGRFLDVSGVHEAGIDCIGWWGVTQGTDDGSYVPGDAVNRAQMATFVARAIELSGGVLPEDAPTAFDDTAGNVHAPSIDTLAALEVVGGVGGGLYAPDREVTRGQMATFLAGAWEARTGEQLASGEVLFDDIDGNVHAEAIAAITAVGWTGGTGEGVYEPGRAVTRAQMGTFLARWLTTLVEDGHATYPPANPVPIPDRPDPEPEQPPATDAQQWQRVAHNETVFGSDDLQMMASVAAGGPGLVAVGSDWGPNAAAVWTSTDGTSWQRVPHDETVFGGDDRQHMYSVMAGGPGLVAVGYDLGRQAGAVWTSTDGIAWQRVPHDETVFGGDDRQHMYSVTAGGPGLVAVGVSGASGEADAAVWTSTDGTSWQRVPHDETVFGGGGLQVMQSVAAGGPGLVAVGHEGDRQAAVWTSTDGIAWQRVPHDETVFGSGVRQAMFSVVAGGPGLVAVGSDKDRDAAAVWTSTDGIAWQRVPHDETVFGGGGLQGMVSVTASGPGLVAVGASGASGEADAAVWTSTDGIAWQRVPNAETVFGGGGSQGMTSVTASGPGLVAVGYDLGRLSAAVWTSP